MAIIIAQCVVVSEPKLLFIRLLGRMLISTLLTCSVRCYCYDCSR